MKHPEMKRIKGTRLALRLVGPADAAYIHALRTNPRYNGHLSAVAGTVEDQQTWITRYKAREAVGAEYYYVIERLHDGLPCGVVRLYDFRGGTFTWGSWILDHNKPAKAALESAHLVYKAAFETLNLNKAVFDVRRKNKRVITFHERFGATRTSTGKEDIFFEYTRDRFQENLSAHLTTIKTRNATECP